MAVPVRESIDSNQATSTGPSHTVPITQPAVNELIVFGYAREGGGTGAPTSVQDQLGDDLDPVQDDWSDDAKGGMWYKIADGDETDIVVTQSGLRGEGAAAVYSGCDITSPLEDSDEDLTNIGTNVFTGGCGTATPVNAEGVAVAMFMCERSSKRDSGSSISLSGAFSVINSLTRSNAVAGIVVGEDIYSSAVAKTCVLTASDSDEQYGCIAVFKAAAGGGGPTVSPLGAHLVDRQHAAIAAHRLGGVLQ